MEILGGRVRELGSSGADGYIKKTGDRSFVIGLGSKPHRRKRFTIAHELGHLFLHMGYIINPVKWSSVGTYMESVHLRYGHSEEEYEANEFAGAFLMPREEFEIVAEANRHGGYYSISAIAYHFEVSEDAARMRGRWLGLFSWDR